MVYRNVECPHCGNDISVKNTQEEQKCRWCKRMVKAKFERRKNGRYIVNVEPVEFKLNPRILNAGNKNTRGVE